MEVLKRSVENGKIIKINFGSALNDSSETLSGNIELDIENQNQFIEHVNTIFDEGVNLVIIEMENISYIDSSGLWALFESHKKASQKNGKIVLLNPRKDVKRVLDITKMSTKISITEDESEAITYLLN